MITCPNCNHQNEVGSLFCENCGHDLREMIPSAPPSPQERRSDSGVACSNCGHTNIPGSAFCENCGAKLGQVVPPVVPQPGPAEGHSIQLKCSNCGHENIPGSFFCENCGNSLTEVSLESKEGESKTPKSNDHLPTPSAVKNLCSQCGHSNPAGSLYCENCGNQLDEDMFSSEVQPEMENLPPELPQIEQVLGKLVLPDAGVSIEIPLGLTEVLIGREDPISGIFPDIDLDPYGGHDGGVGRRHAKLIAQGSQVMIEDLNSVNGTLVNRRKLTPNQPYPLSDGAELRLGKILIVYHTS
jgi:uncharacterized OB-fold protein